MRKTNKKRRESVDSHGSRTAKSVKLNPGAVYVQNCVPNELSKLHTLDLTTGKATFIGEIDAEVTDIAFVGSQLYGLASDNEKTQLVKIDLNSGSSTTVGDIGNACAGLAYNPQRQTLYASTAKQLIAINLETGKGKPVVTVADEDYNCSEVAFGADGKAYITLIGYNKKKLLASCDLNTGEVSTIGDTGFADLASMEFVGDVLYGVTGNFFNLGKDGQLIQIDTTTGRGTLVAMTDPISRWAGITIYEPAPVGITTIAPEVNSDEESEEAKVQEAKAAKGESMSILTIDTKDNCYIIDAEQMGNLQRDVANSFTFDRGTFDIRISGGRYSYAKTGTEGEPFVLLWIYGVDGNTFINQNTGFEVGATWTTLNGYDDSLKLEVKERAVLCALFFDFSSDENNGSVELLITSGQPFFNPCSLTVDSKRNCYILDENYLSSLKQSGSNLVELNPGNYRIKIREGNANYWSKDQKFSIEPWALIWIEGGKFVSKLTGTEVEKAWCSLNGLKDEVILEVREKTRLTGLFFDTFKDDNEGQIVLEIEPVSEMDLAEKYEQQEIDRVKEPKQERIITNGSTTSLEGTGESASGETVSASSSMDFTFRFDEGELKKKWEEQLQQIDASIKVLDEGDMTLEAKYWDQLEQLLLKNYEKHFKNLAVEVAKVRFTMDTYMEQMEFSLNQQLQGWSSYLDGLLQEKINAEISKRTNQQINQYFDQFFEQKIRNSIGLIINNLINKQELNQHIEQQINRQIDQSFERKISSSINGITQRLVTDNTELEQYISRQIDSTYEQKLQERIPVITRNIVSNNEDLNLYIDRRLQQSVISNPGINNEILNLVINSTEINDKINNVYTDIDTKIASVRNEWNGTFISLVGQHVDELINIIGERDTFNLRIANSINIKVNELLSQIMRTKNELTATMNNADRHLYEWTLGELMAIKGCLTDRQALVEQLISFSSQLRTQLDCATCADINTIKPFKPNLLEPKPRNQQQLPGS